jgi:hypothetical protein
MDGALSVAGNLPTFFDALKLFVARIPSKPETDNDFATCEAACKALKKAEEALDAAENGALASITPVEEMRRMVADCRKLARETRLASEKLVERRKIEIKEQAVLAARSALDAHIAALNAELAPMRLHPVAADFVGSIKGLRSIASMQDALDTTLATAKIAADAQAGVIRQNLAAFKLVADGLEFLFADLAHLVHKASDDFAAVIGTRITTHRATEDEKARKAAETLTAIAPAAPAPATPTPQHTIATTPAAVQRAPASEPPTLRLGQINERLGYTVTADLLASLGFVAHTDRAAKLYREGDFSAICAALAAHTIKVGSEIKEAA